MDSRDEKLFEVNASRQEPPLIFTWWAQTFLREITLQNYKSTSLKLNSFQNCLTSITDSYFYVFYIAQCNPFKSGSKEPGFWLNRLLSTCLTFFKSKYRRNFFLGLFNSFHKMIITYKKWIGSVMVPREGDWLHAMPHAPFHKMKSNSHAFNFYPPAKFLSIIQLFQENCALVA